MIPDPLPPDLLALERELASRSRPDPSPGLRVRVLEADCRQRTGAPARHDFGRFAAAAAAVALVAINLSASIANNTAWHLRTSAAGADITDTARRIRELVPDVPDREALRQALLLRAAAGLAPTPVPAHPAEYILLNKDPKRWAMH